MVRPDQTEKSGSPSLRGEPEVVSRSGSPPRASANPTQIGPPLATFSLRSSRGKLSLMGKRVIAIRWAIGLALVLSRFGSAEETLAEFAPEDLRFFEQKIRPVLAERCYSCHSAAA